jgi:hypothetical protein
MARQALALATGGHTLAELDTALSAGQIAAACEAAARALSMPGRDSSPGRTAGRRAHGRRAHGRVRLARVGASQLDYDITEAGSRAVVIVRLSQTDDVTRVVVHGPPAGLSATFSTALIARIRAAGTAGR